VAVGGQGNCADSWDPSLIFDPSFAEYHLHYLLSVMTNFNQ
jgi:hypothetical protein